MSDNMNTMFAESLHNNCCMQCGNKPSSKVLTVEMLASTVGVDSGCLQLISLFTI